MRFAIQSARSERVEAVGRNAAKSYLSVYVFPANNISGYSDVCRAPQLLQTKVFYANSISEPSAIRSWHSTHTYTDTGWASVPLAIVLGHQKPDDTWDLLDFKLRLICQKKLPRIITSIQMNNHFAAGWEFEEN